MTPHERAMEALRVRCKEVYQQLGRDAMLRQNDPVETLFAFAKELVDEHSYTSSAGMMVGTKAKAK